ncbi:MAG: pirin family protein [Betaproteobacteria bacterium]|nr:MAG: pirin family protein [Betaproteobacteria bacterium]
MKSVLSIHRQGEGHWVGDGFPVHTVFHYQERPELSPFLLLDHAGPADFAPSDKARGVGWHPHRGFETVTVVLDGEVDHEDTAGNGGRIASGDVQWMTAGAGLLHKEMHSPEFTRRGGRFQALQLWVNLPAKSKMTPPRYQTLLARDVPAVSLPRDGGLVRVIAGGFGSAKGPARTFTPVNLLDVNLRAGHSVRLNLRDGFSGALYVLKGRIVVNNERASETELVVLDREGDEVLIEAASDARLFVMNGAPIDEPLAGYGPFVMNTPGEIR